MVRAKNYETMSTLNLLKLCRKKLWPLFSGHGVDCGLYPSLIAQGWRLTFRVVGYSKK